MLQTCLGHNETLDENLAEGQYITVQRSMVK